MTKNELKLLRNAVANYMMSEGCTCCQDIDGHREHEAAIAKLLEVPAYDDGSGYDFPRFADEKYHLPPQNDK